MCLLQFRSSFSEAKIDGKKMDGKRTRCPKTGWRSAYAVFFLCAASVGSHGQTFNVLYRFGGADGAYPYDGLVQGMDGNFYGTTRFGGANTCIGNGCGTVFKITPGGILTTLYNFCGQPNCADGYGPSGGLIQATDGNFYGTTEEGGASGYGTVFKITPLGTLTTLYSFCGQPNCGDGINPTAGLTQASDGNFYGTTFGGGGTGYGTVFKMTPGGTLTTLYNFCPGGLLPLGCTDGQTPQGGLIQATDGNLYGTTQAGGWMPGSYGTVFKITRQGTFTTLYSFSGTDGRMPTARLAQATDGNIYGTTRWGGLYGYGTVFKIIPAGLLVSIHSFDRNDGAQPAAALVPATDGSLYGTAPDAGPNSYGTIFKMTTGGTLTTLHSFGGNIGAYPWGGLIQATDGKFYGTTSQTGSSNNNVGTVFSLDVGLPPPQPALSGKIVYSPGQLTQSLTLTNTGKGEARNIWINVIALRTLGGSGRVTLTTPVLPLFLGDLAPGGSTAVPLSLTIPSTVMKFSITEAGNMQDVSGNTLNYSIGQVVLP